MYVCLCVCVSNSEVERRDTSEGCLTLDGFSFSSERSFSLPSLSRPPCASQFNALSDKTLPVNFLFVSLSPFLADNHGI